MISVDAGNTRIKALVFNEDGSVAERQNWPTSARAEALMWLQQQSKPLWICDSTGYDWPVGRQVRAEDRWSFQLDYAPTVGVDRLAALEGARQRFPSGALLMVSLGTCITYSYLSTDHRFQGGAISLGWTSRLRALHEFTGSLPRLDPVAAADSDPRTATSEASMLRGVFQGMLDELSAEIHRFEKINGDLTLIFTGGDGLTFANHLKKGIFADENWVALGLWALAQK